MDKIPYKIALSLLFLDQTTKWLVKTRLSAGDSIPLLKGVFHITLVYNTGIAFGLFRGSNYLFASLSLLVVLVILVTHHVLFPATWKERAAIGLILGGAMGNLIDRFRFGYVVDFVDLRIWPVFNFADGAISCGAFLLFMTIITRRDKRDGEGI